MQGTDSSRNPLSAYGKKVYLRAVGILLSAVFVLGAFYHSSLQSVAETDVEDYIFWADSEEEALRICESNGFELVSYAYGIAEIRIPAVDVYEDRVFSSKELAVSPVTEPETVPFQEPDPDDSVMQETGEEPKQSDEELPEEDDTETADSETETEPSESEEAVEFSETNIENELSGADLENEVPGADRRNEKDTHLTVSEIISDAATKPSFAAGEEDENEAEQETDIESGSDADAEENNGEEAEPEDDNDREADPTPIPVTLYPNYRYEITTEESMEPEGFWLAPDGYSSDTTGQWHLSGLNMNEAWQYSTGTGVKVAVIDSGIDTEHPALTSNIAVAETVIPDSAYGAGGYSLVYKGAKDAQGHGTHVSGIIAAKAADGSLLGIAPDARIYSIKALEKNGTTATGLSSWITAAIYRAIELDVDVINMSVGGSSSSNALMSAALQQAVDAGIIVVTSNGNYTGTGTQSMIDYPARYSMTLGISAGRWNESEIQFDERYSKYGSGTDLLAPGSYIVSTAIGGGDTTLSGTSMACGVASGYFALLKAKAPQSTAAQLIQIAKNTAIDKGDPGYDVRYGYGVIDPVSALLELQNGVPPRPPVPTPAPVIDDPEEEKPSPDEPEEPGWSPEEPEDNSGDEIFYIQKNNNTEQNDGSLTVADGSLNKEEKTAGRTGDQKKQKDRLVVPQKNDTGRNKQDLLKDPFQTKGHNMTDAGQGQDKVQESGKMASGSLESGEGDRSGQNADKPDRGENQTDRKPGKAIKEWIDSVQSYVIERKMQITGVSVVIITGIIILLIFLFLRRQKSEDKEN